MKKTMAALLALVLVFSLCACQAAKPFTAGTTADNHYESAFAGIGCTLSSDWVFMTDAEIQANNQSTMDMLGEDYAAALEKATVVTDMFATHANQMDTVNVTFEKLSGANTLLDAKGYAEISDDTAVEALESAGFANMTSRVGTIQFAGAEHVAIYISGTYSEVPMYETMALVKVGNYIMLVTACTWYEDTTADILANFTAL